MNDKCISSVHLQKLGHPIQEIRERALESIASKLERGFYFDNDLARSKELLGKLFDWFLQEPCTKEDTVLELMKRILLSESGQTLLKHYGSDNILTELRKIRTFIDPKYMIQLEEILSIINDNVPPFECSVPLSFRSGDSVVVDNFNSAQSTATPFEVIVISPESTEQEAGALRKEDSVTLESVSQEIVNGSVILPYYVFPWQPLIPSDRHVLDTVEESLKNSSDPSTLLHFCEFFTDVMLQDYPVEVFLQRPSIILAFQGFLQTSSSTRVSNAIFSSLLKLSELLLIRINYYNDPSTHTSKQTDLQQNVGYTYKSAENRQAEEAGPAFSESSLSSGDSVSPRDIECLKENQMSLPKFCLSTVTCILNFIQDKPDLRLRQKQSYRKQSGVNTALSLLGKLLNILKYCVSKEFWCAEQKAEVTEVRKLFYQVFFKLGETLEYFRIETYAEDSYLLQSVTHLHLIYFYSDLLKNLIPEERLKAEIPLNLKKAMGNLLVNPILFVVHCKIHDTILSFVESLGDEYEMDLIRNYKEVKNICNSMTAFTKFMKSYKHLSLDEVALLAKEATLSLQLNKNRSFVGIVIDIVAGKLTRKNLESTVATIVKDVVLALLSHSDTQIQVETYKICHRKIGETISPKLNVSKTGSPGTEICFLLQSEIFIELASFGILHENEQIRKYSEEILVEILKSKLLVPDEIWSRTLQAITPALPILLCHTDKSTTLGRTLLGFLDPDTAKSLCLPILDVIKGNVQMLYTKEQQVRSEAASRLSWILASQPDSKGLLPRFNNLQDRMVANSLLSSYVVDVNKCRNTDHYYQQSNLMQVLELLKSSNVEPVIRRSALTQISVMMEDNLLHRVFLEHDGMELVLKVMKTALTEQDYSDYPDSIIPVISILKNVCLHNSSIRNELADNVEFFYLSLRGLFMFVTEERLKQDMSMLLLLLVFSSFFRGSSSVGNLSLPAIVLDKIQTPLICGKYGSSSENTLPSVTEAVLADRSCLSVLQIHWNLECSGGMKALLNSTDVEDYRAKLTEEFNEILKLTRADLNLLKSSSLEFSLKKYAFELQNCTSYLEAVESISKLMGYIQLLVVVKTRVKWKYDEVFNIPWENTFSRFLTILPSGEEDVTLLIQVLQFLTSLVPLYKTEEFGCWITSFLKDTNHRLFDLLEYDSDCDAQRKSLSKQLLHLTTICVSQEQHFLDYKTPAPDKHSATSWRGIIEIIVDNLKFSETQHFYNLAYLDCLLTTLVHLTASLGWSCHHSGSKEVIRQLIPQLCDLVIAFYYGKGASAAQSVMGLSITRNVLLVLNHLVAEFQLNNFKNWELYFLAVDDDNSDILKKLFTLRNSRDVILKAAVLQLFGGLSVKPRLALEIVRECAESNRSVWEITLSVCLDSEEASIARENAVILLTNLSTHISHLKPSSGTVLSSDSEREGNKAGIQIFELMEENGFFKELTSTLKKFNTDNFSTIKSDSKLQTNPNNEFTYVYNSSKTLKSDQSTSSSKTTEDNKKTGAVTPSLIKSLALLVQNLLNLASQQVSTQLHENGLVKLFFRCLVCPALELKNTKQLALYCEILEMNVAVCGVLNKAVTSSRMCLGAVLHTRDCLNVIISFLNPLVFYTHLPQLVYLRNRLWSEVFGLIGTILELSFENQNAKERGEDALLVISNALSECGSQPFLQTLCESVDNNEFRGLQESALSSLTSLLRVETSQTPSSSRTDRTSSSMQSLLDSISTPRIDTERTSSNEAETRVKDSETTLLERVYFGAKLEARGKSDATSEDSSMIAGAKICKILLQLYESNSLSNAGIKRRTFVANALSSVLCVSKEAKRYALENGLLETLIEQLREVHIKLSLESVDNLRRPSDKKRVSPLLRDMDNLVGLLTNFMITDVKTKAAAARHGLADLIHKLFVWALTQREYLLDVLKMLCTFTTQCSDACLSLTLTSTIAGSGLRRAPCNESLVHTLCNLVSKEMDLVSKSHDLTALQLIFHVLQNCCSVTECRIVLAKSNFLQSLTRLHPSLTKRQKPWETVELLWLEFLLTFTGHPEGQSSVGKVADAIEILMSLTTSPKATNRREALSVLRNVAFYQSNRPRLLASSEFLHVLGSRLSCGTDEERSLVVTMVWALAANSQKAKLVLKCARLDEKLQNVLKQYSAMKHIGVDRDELEMMHFVLKLLKDGEKVR